MTRPLFPIEPLMTYSPSRGAEQLVLHCCKGGVAGRVLDQLYDKRSHRAISVTCAWDDGSGRAVEPLADVFAGAPEVHVLCDVSPYGLVALRNVAALLDRVGARWRRVGITDRWLLAIPETAREAWIASQSIPMPAEMRHISPRRMERILGATPLDSRCRSVLGSGHVLELEAFLRPELRAPLQRLVRSM